MKNLGLRGKLYFVAAVVVLGFCAFGLLALNTLQVVQVNGPYYRSIVQGKDVIADVLPPPEYILETYLVAFQMWAEPDAREQAQLAERVKTLESDYQARHEFWQGDLAAGELKTRLLVDSYTPALEFYRILNSQFLPAIQRGERDAAAALLSGALKEQYRQHRAGVDQVVALATQRNQNDEQEARAVIQARTAWMIGIGGAIGLGLILTFAALARAIVRPINRIIAGLNEGSDQVNDAAAQVAAASQQLAEGASEQASSLEETSSALEEMAAMTRTNAENARQANELSDQAKTAAQDGDQTMTQLNSAMAGINESSGKISKIIKVIEEIAFQTNLLALNAAVEAARAGEHGKGFAVVADEVRNLAQRAAQASREVTGLIEDSVGRAREGTTVASEVAKSLGAIVADVAKVADLVNGITRASQEQAQGVDQVNMAVSQMNKVTQQNAAGAEESASAAQELSAQAATVKGMVDELAGVIGGAKAQAAAQARAATRTRKTVVNRLSATSPSQPQDAATAVKQPEVVPAPTTEPGLGDF